ncbi:MAG: rRNA pseudouridine synthase [Clostridia bacterium]|nr:rRNA pseudouridine synthase [Clostridia bacterium]
MEPVRIQKYLSDCGILSRRAAEQAIRDGDVLVDGVVPELGTKILPGEAVVTYRGQAVEPRADRYVYVLLNKPRGVVTTASDEKGRPAVTDLVDLPGRRLYPVGRLDMDSDGMVILTDDGSFAQALTHPRHHVPKTYEVSVAEALDAGRLDALNAPMELDGYRLKPVEVSPLDSHAFRIVLHEGRNRQIRRMCEHVGLHVTRLTRTAVGTVRLGHLKLGQWRHLSTEEVRALRPDPDRNQ